MFLKKNYPFAEYPFIRLIVPFIIGIFAFRIFPFYLNIQILEILLITLFCGIIILHFINSKTYKQFNNILWGFLLYIFLIISSYTLSSIQYPQYQFKENKSKNSIAIGVIKNTPEKKANFLKLNIDIQGIKIQNQWKPSKGNCILYINIDSNANKLYIGDIIAFKPNLDSIKNKGNPNEFDYQSYLAFHFIAQSAFLKSNDWIKISSEHNFSIIRFAEHIRNKVLAIFNDLNLPNQVSAIASAITLGYKNEIDSEIKQSYVAAGATHILAVSGLHVGVIYLIIQYILFFLKKNSWQKWVKLFLIIIFLWFYAFITGLSPSVVRATTMFSFVAIGKQLNRHTNIYNILAASAFFILCINPFLLFDLGFQLSYIAVIGIVYFQPKIRAWFHSENQIIQFIWDLISVTIAAQIVTTPLSLYYFHQFPTYFLLSGIVLVPITSFVIYLTILNLIFYNIPFISIIFNVCLKYLILFMNGFTQFIEKLPIATITNIYVNEIQLILLYLILLFLTVYLIQKKIHYLKYLLFTIFIFSLIAFYNKFIQLQQKNIYVYNINQVSTLNFINGTKNVLFAELYKEKNIHIFLQNHWISMGLEQEKILPFHQLTPTFLFTNLTTIDNPNIFTKKHFFNFYGYKILVINDDFFFKNKFNSTIKVDAIILQKEAKVDIQKLLKYVYTKQIIIDSSCSQKKINFWKKKLKDTNISIYIVKEKGAWSYQI
ncbi:MAG: ComEC/Rec2 family competence protein [Bacteroidales bacterium]|nr:ComEC/Rec2 family competence protein [Bacteroidales bacterium]